MRQKHYENKVLICGIHSCYEAINTNNTKILRVYLIEDKKYPEWVDKINKNVVRFVTKEYLDRLVKNNDIAHQGIVIEMLSNSFRTISDLKKNDGSIAILDNVTDPHNVGAIIRSAAVFGIKAIIVHNRSACKISETVIKTSSGGLSHVKIYPVSNIATTIKELKSYGFWIVSLSEKGDKYLHEIDLRGKICVILGAEGSGIRRLQLENSDFIAKIPTASYFSTLNVSNAASITFYEIARQNNFKIG